MDLFSSIVETNGQWEELAQLDGVVVIDVYSNWCGPCSSMVLKLKNIKQRFNKKLHLVIAKSDNIEYLEQFRNKSEPTWLFMIKGKIVNVMYGANAPKLIRIIFNELKKDNDLKDIEYERITLEINDLLRIKKEDEEIKKEEDEREKERLKRKLEAEAEAKKIRDVMLYDNEFIYRPF